MVKNVTDTLPDNTVPEIEKVQAGAYEGPQVKLVGSTELFTPLDLIQNLMERVAALEAAGA